ncbi:unnamed protein product [Bursaphelenchus xylophilus]|uniref:(pine wood nematode) hypothetical protein n=1 Tax=Bursaphelenchus xylophilus TaxID=6326 RepID=A0A7I8XD55_BURXY|nr:unnamed protein product [Bursaphelenchus xylophilus]CAG9114125.1 unnamed protein product [Bursaphelenchus xylophilus]
MRSSLELFQAAAEWIIVLAFFFLNIFLVKETYRALKWRFEKDALNEDFEKVATKLKLCSSFEILIYIVHGVRYFSLMDPSCDMPQGRGDLIRLSGLCLCLQLAFVLLESLGGKSTDTEIFSHLRLRRPRTRHPVAFQADRRLGMHHLPRGH